MRKIPFKKIQTFLLVVISIALVITSVQLYRAKQENKRQYKTFLNQFYFTLDETIESVDYILDEESLEGDDVKDALARVAQDLDATQLALDAGSRYVDHDIYAIESIFRRQPISQFAMNDELMTEEEQYLKNLKSDLSAIHEALGLDETRQENPHLSVDEFNNFIKGRGLDSDFLTMDKSLDVPFQVIDMDQAPDRIGKWLAKNESVEQRKAFRVNGQTYVLIIPGDEKDNKQATITDVVRKSGGITVSYDSHEQIDDSERKTPWVIAELESVGNQSFQFTTQLGTDESTGNVKVENNELHVQSNIISAELIFVEELSKDGEIVE